MIALSVVGVVWSRVDAYLELRKYGLENWPDSTARQEMLHEMREGEAAGVSRTGLEELAEQNRRIEEERRERRSR